jgi:hypothetical protein
MSGGRNVYGIHQGKIDRPLALHWRLIIQKDQTREIVILKVTLHRSRPPPQGGLVPGDCISGVLLFGDEPAQYRGKPSAIRPLGIEGGLIAEQTILALHRSWNTSANSPDQPAVQDTEKAQAWIEAWFITGTTRCHVIAY